jgi:hypothetical protein
MLRHQQHQVIQVLIVVLPRLLVSALLFTPVLSFARRRIPLELLGLFALLLCFESLGHPLPSPEMRGVRYI